MTCIIRLKFYDYYFKKYKSFKISNENIYKNINN